MVDVTGALPSSPGQLNISLVQSRECGALLRATDQAAYTTVEKDLSSDRPPPPQHPAWAENSTPIYHACIHATLDYVCFYIQRWVHCCWTTPGWSSEMKKWIALSSAIDCFFCESLFLSFDVVRSRILRMERYNGVQSHYYDTVIGTMVIGKVALLSSSPLIKGLAEWGALKE